MTEKPDLKWILSNDTRLVPKHLFESAGLESIMDTFFKAAERNLTNPAAVIIYGTDGAGLIQAAVLGSKDWIQNVFIIENVFNANLEDQNLLDKLRSVIDELKMDAVFVLEKRLLFEAKKSKE